MSKKRAFSDNIRAFGWPPILSTSVAATYCNVSKWTIKRAAARGELPVAGRRGRSTSFRRDDLDSWMLGAREGAAQAAGDVAPLKTRKEHGTVNEALERLRHLNSGGGTR